MAANKPGFGLDDLGALAGKAKEHLTDKNIDTIAAKVTAVAPDSVDKAVAALAEKAKQANNSPRDERPTTDGRPTGN